MSNEQSQVVESEESVLRRAREGFFRKTHRLVSPPKGWSQERLFAFVDAYPFFKIRQRFVLPPDEDEEWFEDVECEWDGFDAYMEERAWVGDPRKFLKWCEEEGVDPDKADSQGFSLTYDETKDPDPFTVPSLKITGQSEYKPEGERSELFSVGLDRLDEIAMPWLHVERMADGEWFVRIGHGERVRAFNLMVDESGQCEQIEGV